MSESTRHAGGGASEPRARDTAVYLYRFGHVEFDEARSELRVGGLVVDLEPRPLQLLGQLLRHPDEVVTRAELFETVWQGRPTVDNVLANAVAKLRKALGADGDARIVTLPRVGYRLSGPVERIASGRRLVSRLDLAAGMPVPGRPHFLLESQLGPSLDNEIWLARHGKTGELRVYKFGADGQRLAALKREATIYRVLIEGLGPREDFVRVIDWNFETAPFFLECEYGGANLADWAAKGKELQRLPQEQRLQLFLQIADAVAAAHSVGVLHKDLKPGNVLIQSRSAGGLQTRIADFGNSRLLEPERLAQLGITAMGMTLTQAMAADSSGTPLYLAPEVLGGGSPTAQSDVFALGLMLYQLVVGNLRRPLAPGWEADISDELLREDIAAATDLSPARRLGSVAELCERLRGREDRRSERARLRAAEERARLAERQAERSRVRRPWIAAAGIVLVLGLAVSLWQFHRASSARDEARREAQIATAVNQFLNEDLLGTGADTGGTSPAWYETNPRLDEILDEAARHVDQRYAQAPLLAVSLHRTLGRAYLATGAYAKATRQLQAVSDLLRRHAPADDPRGILADYELAAALGRMSQFAQATKLIDQADARAGARLSTNSNLSLQSSIARADLLYQQVRVAPALAAYQRAAAILPAVHPDDAVTYAHVQLGIAGCELRMNRAAAAEQIARHILAGAPFTQERVGRSILALARSRLGDALRAQGRLDEAIPVLTQAVDDYRGSQGPSGQGTLTVLSALGYVYSLKGDVKKALEVQRQVYLGNLARWGAHGQSTLVELLNLGSTEYDAGDVKGALRDLTAADRGLVQVSGPDSPIVQAARVAEANALNDLGEHAAALGLIEKVDPVAYQATTSDPGRAAVLKAMHARILLDLKRRAEGRDELREAVAEMKTAGVSSEELKAYTDALDAASSG